jgi:hypothetical protein
MLLILITLLLVLILLDLSRWKETKRQPRQEQSLVIYGQGEAADSGERLS